MDFANKNGISLFEEGKCQLYGANVINGTKQCVDTFNAFRKGRQLAITATARKPADITWNMVVKKQEYAPGEKHMFLDEKRKLGMVKRLRKKIAELELKPEDLGFATG